VRLLGIDFGQRRIGLARSWGDGRVAEPWQTLHVRGRDDALDRLADIIQHERIDRIVVGLPLTADGERGTMALRVERWGRVLAKRTGTAVVFVDEYASSREAEARLRETPSGRRRSIDEIAATLILQDYLDGEAVA